jgi:hypothetical protein
MPSTSIKQIPNDSVVSGPEQLPVAWIKDMFKSQYFAALTMLRDAIEACPDDLWARESDTNKFWQHAYHAIYFTHLYSGPNPEAFNAWGGQHGKTQNDDSIPGPPDPKSDLALMPEPYTKEEVLAYWQWCWDGVEAEVDALDLASPESGFWWYKVPKLEHQIVSIRHLQHHAAQLIERLRTTCGIGTKWRGKGGSPMILPT